MAPEREMNLKTKQYVELDKKLSNNDDTKKQFASIHSKMISKTK